MNGRSDGDPSYTAAVKYRDAFFSEAIKARKTEALLAFIAQSFPPPTSILVVGCGSGAEAGMLARRFKAEAYGIDVCDSFAFDHEGACPAILKQMDARALDFPAEHFDLVYSFHALEHILDPAQALREMARVLRPGGHFVIGTPNRSRLLGYFGAPHPLRLKAKWNLLDWRMRLAGKWTNAAGAHAGFSAGELMDMTRTAFGRTRDITSDYYRLLYPGHTDKIALVEKTGLRALVYPCVYVSG